jgi:hypothetical protein
VDAEQVPVGFVLREPVLNIENPKICGTGPEEGKSLSSMILRLLSESVRLKGLPGRLDSESVIGARTVEISGGKGESKSEAIFL